MALPTKGRVIIVTTVGEIDIELWSKETPKTCRNFLALAMEGYYDGVIFHRVVPGFLVQTGDRTGTGGGGESFYGEPFEDEIHPRLRFAHRGLVAMANAGRKNSNDSQFIITLDRADELHGKHTLFGRCMGDTLYNVLKIGEMELDASGRPVYPPKIKSVRILDNPFPDIVPRITAEERRAQQKARDQVAREREEEARRKGAKKNVKLLSFASEEDAQEGEQSEEALVKKGPIFRPDLTDTLLPTVGMHDFSTIRTDTVSSEDAKIEELKTERERKKRDVDINKIREQHAQEQAETGISRRKTIEKVEAEIRKLSKKRDGGSDDEDVVAKKPKVSYLDAELAKYAKGRGIHKKGRKRDEGDVLKAMEHFRGKLKNSMAVDDEVEGVGEQVLKEGEEGVEVDDDQGFMGHALRFPKNQDEEVKAERDYEVIDPRQRSAQARRDEREKKEAERRNQRQRR